MIFIDIIRIFACICILTIHFNASISGYDISGHFLFNNGIVNNIYGGVYLGQIGCGLFFIISGCGLFINNQFLIIDKASISNFYLKRAKALYPMFWIAFGFATLFKIKSFPNAPIYHLLFSISGFDGYSEALGFPYGSFYKLGEWFLGCILLIYFVYPFISFLFLASPLGTCTVMAIVYSIFITRVNYIWFFLELPYILMGMFFIKYVKSASSIKTWVLTLLLLVIKAVYGTQLHQITNELIFNWTLFLALVLVIELLPEIKGKTLYFLKTLSKMTYPLFLVHHVIIAKICSKLDLATITYKNVVIIYIIYILVSVLAAIVLQKICAVILQKINIARGY